MRVILHVQVHRSRTAVGVVHYQNSDTNQWKRNVAS